MEWLGFVTGRYLRLSELGELLLILLALLGIAAIGYAMFQKLKPPGASDVSTRAYALIALVVIGLLVLLVSQMEWLSPTEVQERVLDTYKQELKEGAR
jgi:hypothetical protein